MIVEGDKVKIVSGKYKGSSGYVYIKTGNGWYHIISDGKKLKLRLVNVVLVGNRSYKKYGIKKDAIFDKKITTIKTQIKQYEKNIKRLSKLNPGYEYRKTVIKAKENKRQIPENLSFLFNAHRKVKKRTKRRLSTIPE
jgi:hypothetical protein